MAFSFSYLSITLDRPWDGSIFRTFRFQRVHTVKAARGAFWLQKMISGRLSRSMTLCCRIKSSWMLLEGRKPIRLVGKHTNGCFPPFSKWLAPERITAPSSLGTCPLLRPSCKPIRMLSTKCVLHFLPFVPFLLSADGEGEGRRGRGEGEELTIMGMLLGSK